MAQGQESKPSDPDTQTRIDQLEKQVQELRAMLQGTALPPPRSAAPPATDPAATKAVEGSAPSKDDKGKDAKKADDKPSPPEYSVVGDDLALKVSWDNGGFRFRSADEAFNLHMGGRLMFDDVWWNQSPNLRKSPIQPPGSPLANITGVGPGIGDLQDGFFIRRARFVADGTIYQTIDFKVEFDFENFNSIVFDESYVGARDLPIFDIIRMGQTHVPFGLEAYTSSRYLPMLERSPLFDAFYQEFAPGFFTDRTFFDQHMTMQHMFHRTDYFNQFNGASFGDGKYAYSGRVTFLPVYEEEGRCLLHLGLAYQFRKGSPPLDFNGGTVLPSTPLPTVTSETDLVRFRARPSLRDGNGLQGDLSRVVDTGTMIVSDVQAVNGELLGYWGPLWVQSEYCLAHSDGVDFPASKAATRRGNLDYHGTYIQVGYFLTGENRGYDRRMGKYDRVVPLENFFLVKDENGHLQYGLGAWELVYRYAYLNLNDDAVQGGTYSENTVGLNWYWNSNIKIQANYINGQRVVPPGAVSGNVQGFGLRAALEF